jgi:ribosome-associated protein
VAAKTTGTKAVGTKAKTPARKPSAGKTAATKSASSRTRTVVSKGGPKRAAPRSNRADAATTRRAPYRRAPAKPVEAPAPEPEVVIPAELLEDAPKAAKPRKPRGKKAEAPKPHGSLDLVLAQLDDSKAEQIVTINLDDKTAIADTMVVASGRSNRHVGAIADQLVEKLKASGRRDLKVEGMPQCDWVLVDAGDVVVHIFRPEVRSFYNLEKLWSEHAPNERAIQ